MNLTTLFRHSKKYYKNLLVQKFGDIRGIVKDKQAVVIFGASRMGKAFVSNLQTHRVTIDGVVDNNKSLWGQEINGIEILSLQHAKKIFTNTWVLIASMLYENEILKMLTHAEFNKVIPVSVLNIFYPRIFPSSELEKTFDSLFNKKNQIYIQKLYNQLPKDSKKIFFNLLAFRVFRDKKYIQNIVSYTNPYTDMTLQLSDNEIFVDCGGYIGDSIQQFLLARHKKYSQIYSFEPDAVNYSVLTKLSNKKISTEQMGVYSFSGTIAFDPRGTVDSRIVESKNGNSSINVVSLDDYFSVKRPPTLIKMDIEGSEIAAIKGARSLLQKHKPKLIISIYHRATDLWSIPLLIKKIQPAYTIHIRHFSKEFVDTVCIAV